MVHARDGKQTEKQRSDRVIMNTILPTTLSPMKDTNTFINLLTKASFTDWSPFVNEEIRLFLQDFENKRGNSDFKALKHLENLVLQSKSELTNIKALLETQHDASIESMNKSEELIKDFCLREGHFQEEREKLKNTRTQRDQTEREMFEAEQIAAKQEIDTAYDNTLKNLQAKYQVK